MSDSRPLRLSLATGDEPARQGETLLRVGYGDRTQASGDGLQIAMPPLGTDTPSETWTCSRLRGRGEKYGLRFARFDPDLLMGFGVVQEESGLRGTTERLYRNILALLREEGCPYLVRIWNHFPGITAQEGGMGRYQQFCAGRREAIAGEGATATMPLPAVTTTGTCGQGIAVYFLAAAQPARELQNPRQTPPSRYPESYGPSGYSFCRGARHDATRALYLSGTASITGFETQHHGDPAEQTREALRNQEAVLAQGCPDEQEPLARLSFLKVYLADPRHLPVVRAALQEMPGPGVPTCFLHSALCREDLHLELEGAFRLPADGVRRAAAGGLSRPGAPAPSSTSGG